MTERTGRLVRILAVICAASLVLSGWALLARFNETDQLRQENRLVWHGVVCSIEIQILHDQKASAREQRHAIHFYDGLLVQDVHASPCHLVVKGGH